jgi:hypothetical protein
VYLATIRRSGATPETLLTYYTALHTFFTWCEREYRINNKRADFAHLDGVPIHIAEASRKYGIPATSLRGWRAAGHIKTLGKEKNRILINEADVAYIKAIIETVDLRQGQDLTSYL